MAASSVLAEDPIQHEFPSVHEKTERQVHGSSETATQDTIQRNLQSSFTTTVPSCFWITNTAVFPLVFGSQTLLQGWGAQLPSSSGGERQ